MTMTAMPSPPSPTGSTRLRRRRPFRERRRLAPARAARRVQRLGQALNLAPQTIPLSFEPRVLLAQGIPFVARLLNLAAQPLQLSLCVVGRLRHVALWHATVMADSRKKYKSKSWIEPLNPLTSYVGRRGLISAFLLAAVQPNRSSFREAANLNGDTGAELHSLGRIK